MAVKVAENCSPAASVLLRGLHKTKGVQGPSQMKKKKKLWYICVCVCVFSLGDCWRISTCWTHPSSLSATGRVAAGSTATTALCRMASRESPHKLFECLTVGRSIFAIRYLPTNSFDTTRSFFFFSFLKGGV